MTFVTIGALRVNCDNLSLQIILRKGRIGGKNDFESPIYSLNYSYFTIFNFQDNILSHYHHHQH